MAKNNTFLTQITTRAIISFIFSLAVVIGFFMKLIDTPTFMAVASSAITYYFNHNTISKLEDKLQEKETQISILSSNEKNPV